MKTGRMMQKEISLFDVLMIYSNTARDIDDDISEWTKDNPYTFIRAVIDGYKVEDCYVVILPNSTSTLPNSTSTTHYLQRSKTGKVKLVEGVFELNHHTRLTKQEIESLDKRYFAFAEKVN